MALPKTPREHWIVAGLDALSAGGPDAVRVEALAKTLGVSKGGFYGYFADRGALLNEMLDAWESEITDGVSSQVEALGGDGRQRLRNLLRLATSGAGFATDITTELAIREWSRRNPELVDRVRRVHARQQAYLRGLFGDFIDDPDEIEVRCFIVSSIYLAGHFTKSDNPAAYRTKVLRLTMERLLH